MIQSIKDFKVDAESVSAKFAMADKRANSLKNLSHGRPPTKRKPIWRQCIHPGVPCDCRINLVTNDLYSSSKNLSMFCCQFKCVLTVSR